MAAATGSPASRRLTKLTPLTTRPSLTSRQGMTRTLNMLRRGRCLAQHSERLRRIEPAVIERPAGNGAGKFLGAWFEQGADVVERGKPARGDDRNRDAFGKRNGGVEIETLEHAV